MMKHKVDLFVSSGLRGFQMLFAVVVLGLSVTLIKGHYDSHKTLPLPAAPFVLPLSAAIGAITFVAAIFNLAIAWTNFLRDYVEMLVDMVIIVANMAAGTVCFLKDSES